MSSSTTPERGKGIDFVVKILTSNDGEVRDNPKWHYVILEAAVFRTLCDGEAFGKGDSGCEYKTRNLKAGAITCPVCINKIKMFKSVTL